VIRYAGDVASAPDIHIADYLSRRESFTRGGRRVSDLVEGMSIGKCLMIILENTT
jgi:hypothetical protein